MAKQKGIIRFTGTIDGLTFYESKYGPLVRKKGGPTKEQVKKDPKFKRSRENSKEFGDCAGAAKLLRAAFTPLMEDAKDFQVTARLNKLMIAIKGLDTISTRGQRSVAVGMAFPTANDLAKEFDFNEMAPMKLVLRKSCAVNTTTGVISIPGLFPEKHLHSPSSATHCRISGAWARIDFLTRVSELIGTNQIILPLNSAATNVVLTPAALPNGSGVNIFVLQIVFYQEVNGVPYTLKNGEYNSMAIVEIA